MLAIYNTLTRKKELFEPLVAGRVGLYVCGPTVYGPPHLGHARSAITFDLLFRYLDALDYRVRYVRNVTDVGHLEHDADEGEDKIAKLARLERLEPMEVATRYTNEYHDAMRVLNVLPPSIEPRASGHIIEQIELVKRILAAGYAYEANGSVYFDVEKYAASHPHGTPSGYGTLSGRRIEDMLEGTRALDGGGDKRSPLDFALWKKASPEHIMRWPSPWSDGFPGWHAECSAMSEKYLGERFDIHGGGMDLVFPHHEAEMAQGTACGCGGAKYWMHNNMVTVGGQKMGKSLGNAITLEQFFDGSHPLLERAYSPMTIRFFMLQAHYRSTLDFSNEALQAAEKGLDRLMKAMETLEKITPDEGYGEEYGETNRVRRFTGEHNGIKAGLYDINELEKHLGEAMDDDLGTPLVISTLFDWVTAINRLHDGLMMISTKNLAELKLIFHHWVVDILGLRDEKAAGGDDHLSPVMDLVLELRAGAKADKNWALSDKIRDGLAAAGIKVKDRKDGASEWELE
ncbi:MAG: cysteine--tRNA ligase [Alistipes sp.]|jgi:cysteinyl-tRNA synthetase|nr:cysteine--tRNA ligase [Alistipes sp.]